MTSNLDKMIQMARALDLASLKKARLPLTSSLVKTIQLSGAMGPASFKKPGLQLMSNLVKTIKLERAVDPASFKKAGLQLTSNLVKTILLAGAVDPSSLNQTGLQVNSVLYRLAESTEPVLSFDQAGGDYRAGSLRSPDGKCWRDSCRDLGRYSTHYVVGYCWSFVPVHR